MNFGEYSYLTVGMSGSGVREMQSDLLRLGFSLPQYGADGVFGSETQQTVKDFQYTWGIATDGIVGAQTAAAIKEAIGLLSQGQWSPSNDPLKYSPTVSVLPYPSPPVIRATPILQQPSPIQPILSALPSVSVAGIDLKWVGLGVLGIALIFYLTRKGDEDR